MKAEHVAAIVIAGLIFGVAPDASARYREVDKVDGGSISGTVTLTKSPPAAAKLKITKDKAVCGGDKTDETYVVGANKGFANVVVFLDKVRKGKKIGSPEATIDQKTCQYSPHVLAFPVGTKLFISTSDSVLHNTHTYLGTKTVFNIALPTKGMKVPKVIKEPGVIEFKCDAGHTWMHAWAYVTEHPYVTVTDKDGKFTLSDVPAGKYKVKTWHEKEGEKTGKVEVSKGGTATLDIAY